MIKDLNLRVDPSTAYTPMKLTALVSTQLNVDANSIKQVRVTRRSIDARQRRIMVQLTVRVYIDEEPPALPYTPIEYPKLKPDAPAAVIVGAGPAGLFAALELIEAGIKPIVVERGKDVDSRRKDLAAIAREGVVDPDSNYCFGEGGAGAYSDGKLYTRSTKRGPVDKVLQVFHSHGAQDDILIDAHPHIGSDRLPEVIKAIRNTIINSGGEVHFGERVTALLIDNGEVTGVRTAAGNTFTGPVILATGHSARDVYEMLHRAAIRLEPKGIAVGVRLEHPQEVIDRVRYHSPNGRGKYLPAAEYTMLTRVDGRAVYSFCMCPGGVIVPAASAPGELVVNGMSASGRSGRWANSGMVVEVLPEDVGATEQAPLKMIDFQKEIEKRFYADGGEGQSAPAQRMTDFVEGRPSTSLPRSSYAPGVHPARIDKLLPPAIGKRLQKAFKEFGAKNRGFLCKEALLVGNETRTSSPVRIPRNADTLTHTELRGLYPCGEGAGYAGGIVSAAIDGIRCARSLSMAGAVVADKV
ncbi:MAG: FAD-dependent monooxygenase [Firmicutes bacterium]|nr:FAD-dependent monooxygenase [Bacillota bacterium]MCM1401535.1 FAD-dependent monooxygenase [Bacteroides sp.]